MMLVLRLGSIVFAGCLCLAPPAWGQCELAWRTIGSGEASGGVFALTVFDDGSGEALYAGGWFTSIGGVAANSIASWAGTSWSSLGDGVNGGVDALTVFDDGSGAALFAGGSFALAGSTTLSNISRWDGASWSPLGAGTNGRVRALVVYDDGTGPALYAGGGFGMAGGVAASRMARWDGTTWSPVGTGIGGAVYALAVFDDGSGPALYAGGGFTTAGGAPANHIAKWDGVSWSPLGDGTSGRVEALTVFDDGSGLALYAGGFFGHAGGTTTVFSIAKWNGTSWSPVGGGLASGGLVFALGTFDDGSGTALYAGGAFSSVGGRAANNIAKWDGTSWSGLDAGTNKIVRALTVFNDGSRAALLVGGNQDPGIVSRWGTAIPEVTGQPVDLTVEVLDPAVFSLSAVSTAGPMSIQWRKDGQRLLEDPPRVTGTQATTLRIDSAVLDDAGLYDAVLTNMCGAAATRSALLTVTCYPDCDQSSGAGVLDIFDFLCFQNAFVSFQSYADCDGNNLLNIFDFLCFQDAFAAGCP